MQNYRVCRKSEYEADSRGWGGHLLWRNAILICDSPLKSSIWLGYKSIANFSWTCISKRYLQISLLVDLLIGLTVNQSKPSFKWRENSNECTQERDSHASVLGYYSVSYKKDHRPRIAQDKHYTAKNSFYIKYESNCSHLVASSHSHLLRKWWSSMDHWSFIDKCIHVPMFCCRGCQLVDVAVNHTLMPRCPTDVCSVNVINNK